MKKISHFAAVLPVKDIQKSIKFYRDKLGLSVTFEWGDPVNYIVASRDDALKIHLAQLEENEQPQQSRLYIFCHDVEGIYKEFIENGVNIRTELMETDYGMKDFDIKDPDGHLLVFGSGK